MLSISQSAQKTGLSIKSIRHYEQIGLLQKVPRSSNGYRYYTNSLLQQLHFIKSTKEAGFTLQESKALLALSENTNRSSSDVKKIALQKIEELEARIEQQQLLLASLKKLTQQCKGQCKCNLPYY